MSQTPIYPNSAERKAPPFKLYSLTESVPSERDWLLHLLGPLGYTLEPLSHPVPVAPGALYVYNSVHRMDLPEDFLRAVKSAGGCGLLHIGDEYYRGNFANYAAFDHVVRMMSSSWLNVRGVFPLALGVTNNLGPPVTTPVSERPLDWFFAGDWKADRRVMADRFRTLPGGYLSLPRSFYGERGISRPEYLSKMASTKFAPSPAGNVCIETCRPYEALHFGAIPLLPKRRLADPYADVLGNHPLPAFEDWSSARRFVERQLKQPASMDALQAECLAWWQSEQAAIAARLESFIAEGRAGAFRASLEQNFGKRTFGKADRFKTLLIQQNAQQLTARAQFLISRILHKLKTGKTLTGEWSIRE
jgi:hypothetical protein